VPSFSFPALDYSSAAWTLGVSVPTILAAMFVGVWVRRATRAAAFALAASRATADLRRFQADFRIPEATPTTSHATHRFARQQRRVRTLHDAARSQQELYRDRATRSVLCLWLAITGLALSVTVLHDIKGFTPYVASLELLALICVLHQWWFALRANYSWVAARTRAELLRQENFMSVLFASPGAPPSDAEIDKAFERQLQQIDKTVIQGSSPRKWPRFWNASNEALADRVRRYWKDRRRQLQSVSGVTSPVGTNDLLMYIHSRPLDQFMWYRTSHHRLHRGGRARVALLAVLYVGAIAFALGKVIVSHPQAEGVSDETSALGNILSFVVLATTAISATLTALYMSRNDRSLLHRYAAQEQSIKDWMREFLSRIPGIATPVASPVAFSDISEDVLRLEDLIIAELADWIHISQHDTIELAP